MGLTYSTQNMQKLFNKTLNMSEDGNKYIDVDVLQLATDLTYYLNPKKSNLQQEIIWWFRIHWDSSFDCSDDFAEDVLRAYNDDIQYNAHIISHVWDA